MRVSQQHTAACKHILCHNTGRQTYYPGLPTPSCCMLQPLQLQRAAPSTWPARWWSSNSSRKAQRPGHRQHIPHTGWCASPHTDVTRNRHGPQSTTKPFSTQFACVKTITRPAGHHQLPAIPLLDSSTLPNIQACAPSPCFSPNLWSSQEHAPANSGAGLPTPLLLQPRGPHPYLTLYIIMVMMYYPLVCPLPPSVGTHPRPHCRLQLCQQHCHLIV
jgi:hypothetical protein